MQSSLIRAFQPANIGKTLLLLAAAAAVFVFFGDAAADIIGIIFGAGLLSFLVSPLEMLLEKKLGRKLSSALALVIAALALLAAAGLFLPHLFRQFSVLAEKLPSAFERLRAFMEDIFFRISTVFSGFSMPDPDFSGIEKGITGLAKSAAEYAGSFAGTVYRIVLSIILSFFLLSDREKIFLRLELLLPVKWRQDGVRAGKTILRELKLYLRGQATIALSVGILSSLGLTIIGVPGGVLLGLVVGLFNIIPYFGPLLGGIPAVLLALSAGWQKAALAAGVLFLVQQIDGMVISPRIMGNITGFSPAVVLLALYTASKAGGITGLLLAMPLLMSLRTLYRVFVQRYEKY